MLPNLILKRIFHKSTIDFSVCKFCGQKTDINSDKKKGGKLEKFQYWIPLKRKWFLLNPYRKYFKSFAPRELPKKNWTTWETENIIDDSEIPEIYYPKKSLKEKLKEKIKVFKISQGERKEKKMLNKILDKFSGMNVFTCSYFLHPLSNYYKTLF